VTRREMDAVCRRIIAELLQRKRDWHHARCHLGWTSEASWADTAQWEMADLDEVRTRHSRPGRASGCGPAETAPSISVVRHFLTQGVKHETQTTLHRGRGRRFRVSRSFRPDADRAECCAKAGNG
jgi:hypothetical protein